MNKIFYYVPHENFNADEINCLEHFGLFGKRRNWFISVFLSDGLKYR